MVQVERRVSLMSDRRDRPETNIRSRVWGLLALVLCIALGGILVTTGLDLDELPAEGIPPVEENIESAQVTQPVTAVLLNFRGYDTWLEVGVLLACVFGLLALHRSSGLSIEREEQTDPVLDTVTRLLVPLLILIGGFLLWAGTRIPGGAFQAGAILAAAGVLMRVAGVGSGMAAIMTGLPMRLTAVSGFAFFLVFAAVTVLSGRQLLEYPAGWGGELIFLLEAGVMISVGWTLAFVYMAATPPDPDAQAGDDR